MHQHLVVATDAAGVAEAGARLWADACRHALAARGAFHVALSGGTTPKLLYRDVARVSDLDFAWHLTHVYWSDERAVPPDHELSNYGMAKKALLDDVPLPDGQVHRMRGEAADLDAEARRYAGEIPPAFDLVWLGVGEDGHTASLFPGSRALDGDAGAAVLAVDGPGGAPPRRLTLGLGPINAARRVIVVATGREKADVVARARAAADGEAGGAGVTRGAGDATGLPIARVRPANGHLVWLLDNLAAGT
jgi:6-phosphogluconolactonase